MKNSLPRLGFILLATTALVLTAYVPANAACTDGPCPVPEQPGNQGFDSRVTLRGDGETPPSAEYRRPADEVLVLRENAKTALAGEVSHFSSGQPALTDEEKTSLGRLIAGLNGKIPERVEVVGYADVQPLSAMTSKTYINNLQLSAARAQQVAAFLKSLPGWKTVDIRTVGKGDIYPTTQCTKGADMKAYQACLGNDRRAELHIWYGVPKPQAPRPACKDAKGADSGLPFRISIDGEPEAGKDTPNSADVTRCTDVALDKANIEVRFDGLEATPSLNVMAYPDGVVRGQETTFTPYTNYAAFITKAEIRIFPMGDSVQKIPLAVIPLENGLDKGAVWRAPEKSDLTAVLYVLRVYDSKGHFDETTPKNLNLLDAQRPAQPDEGRNRELLVGYGENHLGIHNIPVSGGAVTVNGDKLAPGEHVVVMGHPVPVDTSGKFAIKQILPSGDHSVSVVTEKQGGASDEFTRNVSIPSNDWFYTGIADVTVGQNNVTGPAALVTGDDSKRYSGDIYTNGHLAFYMKGKVHDDWLLTTSADTQEHPVGDLFSNFGHKDPQSLLQRLDPNAYYNVYGDDSTLQQDAPTDGRFYVKLQKNDSQVMWGNFQTKITGTDLMNYSRSLYGGDARYASTDTTKFGEKRTQAEAFAADPGTLDSIEEFRGTGGSLYYLHNQDVVTGSERLRIEVRDQNSGIVLQTTELVYGQDYDINYIQGRVILNQALQSTMDASTLVKTGSLSGNPAYLVANYEYTPGVTAVDNLTKGGRVSQWIGDYLRVGITDYNQQATGAQQNIGGGDVILRYKPGTYVKAEAARSDGPGTGALSSQDGGFDFGTVPQTVTPDVNALARRAEVAVDLAEVTNGTHKGTLDAYWLKRDDGFSSPGELTDEGVEQTGLTAAAPLTDKLSVNAKGDFKDGTVSGATRVLDLGADYHIIPTTTLSLGGRYDDRQTPLAAGLSTLLAETGERTDAIAKLTYSPPGADNKQGPYSVYGLAQNTLDHDDTRLRNDRYGGGGRLALNNRYDANAEVTDGDGGVGGKVGLEYKPTDRTSYYINYLADNGRSDTGFAGRSNNIVTGSKERYTDSLSVYSEDRYQFAQEGPSGLIHSYGLDYAASDRWTWGGKFENGTTSDPSTGDLKRTAVSLSSGYHHDKIKYGGTVEWRDEDGNATGKRTSWLAKNSLAYQSTPDWRFLGTANFAISNADTASAPTIGTPPIGSATDANYTELTLGYAYRPVKNDKFNALFKYTYLADRPSAGQVSASGSTDNTYGQRSHVLSTDVIYDLTPKLSLGAKVGYRFGQLIDNSVTDPEWFSSAAWLGVARADWHVVHEWDVTGEMHYLDAQSAQDAKSGALIGVYKHINDNVKFGGGYNFTDFSDDLTNLSYKSRGFFINIIGTM